MSKTRKVGRLGEEGLAFRDDSSKLTHASCEHLMRRAEIPSGTKEADFAIRGFFYMKTRKILHKAELAMQSAKRTTLMKQDIKKAAEILGIPAFAIPSKESGKRGSVFLSCGQDKASSAALGGTNVQEVRAQRKASCLIVPKERFWRITKALSSLDSSKIKYRERALDMLQVIVEAYTIRLLEKAHALALHSKKYRVTGADIEAAFKIEHGPV